MPLPRSLLQSLAEARLVEAEALLAAGHPAGAYYLAGYAVELGLKACIARQFRSDEIPYWVASTREFKTHEPARLVISADLGSELEAAVKTRPVFDRNWQIVLLWSVDSRYSAAATNELASQLIGALVHPEDGILTWIRTRW